MKISEEKIQSEEDLSGLKYLLGDYGTKILLAIARGAKNENFILMMSGVPKVCIQGRLPVLLNLNLIVKLANEYYVTQRGKKYLKIVENTDN